MALVFASRVHSMLYSLADYGEDFIFETAMRAGVIHLELGVIFDCRNWELEPSRAPYWASGLPCASRGTCLFAPSKGQRLSVAIVAHLGRASGWVLGEGGDPVSGHICSLTALALALALAQRFPLFLRIWLPTPKPVSRLVGNLCLLGNTGR